MADQKVTAAAKAALESERTALLSQLAEFGAGSDASLTFDENFADSGQVAAEQGETRMLAATLTEQLRDVERALDKLDEGEYGRCEECGAEIAQPRLEAMPATRYCIQHA